MKDKVHKFKVRMTEDRGRLELFSNSLEGEIVAIIPNATAAVAVTYVDFVLVVEKLG